MNVGYLLANSASKYPENTALVTGEDRWTYHRLEERCGRLSGAMLSWGLKPSDRVALLFYNSIPFVETFFASVRSGFVATPINFRLAGREIAYILNDSGAKALFYDPEFEDTLSQIRNSLNSVQLYVSLQTPKTASAINYEKFLSKGKWLPCSEGIEEGHPCQLLYTSGTTGRPKGAISSNRNVLWNLFNVLYGREDRSGQISIIVGPLFHSAALNNHLITQISLGNTCILIRKFEPELVLKTIQEERVNIVSGAAAMYNLLMQHPKSSEYDTSSITKCLVGSSKLPAETKRRLLKFFPNIEGIYDLYGATEASPSISALNPHDSLRKDGSVGQALPFLEVRVVDKDGLRLPSGETGEIVLRGPNVIQGYHNNPEATRETLKNGWLHTGDLGYIDEEDFIYIVDRKKDMIVSGGENIYPREIEEVLFTHPDIAEAAVVGMPDQVWGESVRAFIVLKPKSSMSEKEVIGYCKEHLAGYKKPKRVDFIDEIPRTASGKALKHELRQIK